MTMLVSEYGLLGDISKKKRLMKEIAEHDPGLHARLEYNYNKDKKDEFKYARVYFENYCSNYEQLNEIAWQYFEKETNKTKLEAALIWAEKSISLNKNWYNLDTKANLLNKLGKKKEALAAAAEALEIAKAAGEDPSETEKLIKSLKN